VDLDVTEPEPEVVAVADGSCSVAGCSATTDGRCSQGYDSPLDCPDFDLVAADEGADPESGSAPSTALPVPHGYGLRPGDLHHVLRREFPTWVVPLGTVEAGKTTLLAVLFEQLSGGRMRRWSYVGSATTFGFAQRSHYASMRSGRERAGTPRTSGAAGAEVLHLRCRSAEQSLQSFLFADVSGEHVDELVRGGERDEALVNATTRADVVLILIDGALAAEPASRQSAIRHAVDIVHVTPELPIRTDARVAIVLTKVDLFTDGAAGVVTAAVTQAVKRVMGREPDVFTVAARPQPGTGVPAAAGVEDLLDFLAAAETGEHRPPTEPFAGDPSPSLLQRIWRGR
jgi:hypothetical protein